MKTLKLSGLAIVFVVIGTMIGLTKTQTTAAAVEQHQMDGGTMRDGAMRMGPM